MQKFDTNVDEMRDMQPYAWVKGHRVGTGRDGMDLGRNRVGRLLIYAP